MESPKTPAEALRRAVSYVTWTGGTRRPKGVPGEIVGMMSEETRALLRDLKSDDIAPGKVSDDVAWYGPEDEKRRFRQLTKDECLKFDRDVFKLKH